MDTLILFVLTQMVLYKKKSDFFLQIFLGKEEIEILLKDLCDKDSVKLKSSENQPPPKYTYVETQNIDKDIAKNLVMYGNPFGLSIESNGKKQQNKFGKNRQKTWIEK